MDFMPLRLNSSSLTCSICALAAIITPVRRHGMPNSHGGFTYMHSDRKVIDVSYNLSAQRVMVKTT